MVLANIQSNAVEQFESWAKEEKSFRQAAAKADHERSSVEERLRQLRMQQKQLGIDMRESSNALGHFHREHSLLQQEKERLKQQLKEERLMLDEFAAETEQLTTQDIAAKKEFCKEMGSMNEELSALLMQQHDRRLHNMICAETVAVLREFLAKADDSSKRSSLAEVEAAIKAWDPVNACYENAAKECEMIKKTIETLRARALQQASMDGHPVRRAASKSRCELLVN